PSQCPGTDTDCKKRSCDQGVCGFTNTANGTTTTAQTPGDCKRHVCDGNGGETTVNDNTDVLKDANGCTDDLCNAGSPVNVSSLPGTPCTTGGSFCDGAGSCVECLQGTDCMSLVCAPNHQCVAASCTDLVQNPPP